MTALALPVRYPNAFQWLIFEALHAGLFSVGGFPLWCAGYADTYGDIDLYTTNWLQFYAWHKRLRDAGAKLVDPTPETSQFILGDTFIQLVHPALHQKCAMDVMLDADLSASAIALLWEGRPENRPVIKMLYPDDVRQKVCRVLKRHEWTDYRVKAYQAKGFAIVEGQLA